MLPFTTADENDVVEATVKFHLSSVGHKKNCMLLLTIAD